jgi:hypothetical protein
MYCFARCQPTCKGQFRQKVSHARCTFLRAPGHHPWEQRRRTHALGLLSALGPRPRVRSTARHNKPRGQKHPWEQHCRAHTFRPPLSLGPLAPRALFCVAFHWHRVPRCCLSVPESQTCREAFPVFLCRPAHTARNCGHGSQRAATVSPCHANPREGRLAMPAFASFSLQAPKGASLLIPGPCRAASRRKRQQCRQPARPSPG